MRAKKTELDQLSGLNEFLVSKETVVCFFLYGEMSQNVCCSTKLNQKLVSFMILKSSFVQRLHGGTGRGFHVGRTVPLGSFRNEKGKKLLKEFKQQRRLRQPKSPFKKKNIITLRLLLHARILCCWKSTLKMDW